MESMEEGSDQGDYKVLDDLTGEGEGGCAHHLGVHAHLTNASCTLSTAHLKYVQHILRMRVAAQREVTTQGRQGPMQM